MIFIFSDGGSEGIYNIYKKIVKFEEGMCSFLWGGRGLEREG